MSTRSGVLQPEVMSAVRMMREASTGLAELVHALARATADAQAALDRVGVQTALVMAGQSTSGVVAPGLEVGGRRLCLLELGFTPTFYQTTVVDLEVRVSFTMTHSEARTRTLSAAVSARDGSHPAGSSVVHTRMAPRPGPTPLMELLYAEVGGGDESGA